MRAPNTRVESIFGFDVNLKTVGNVKALQVSFKPELRDVLRTISSSGFSVNYVAFNYPGQMVKNTENYQPIWTNPGKPLEFLYIKISAVEILRRRNKNTDPCFADWTKLDENVLRKHHDTVGCRPPYHQSDKPVCTTKTTIMESFYEMYILMAVITPSDFFNSFKIFPSGETIIVWPKVFLPL